VAKDPGDPALSKTLAGEEVSEESFLAGLMAAELSPLQEWYDGSTAS